MNTKLQAMTRYELDQIVRDYTGYQEYSELDEQYAQLERDWLAQVNDMIDRRTREAEWYDALDQDLRDYNDVPLRFSR
jgi:hypothetical protein